MTPEEKAAAEAKAAAAAEAKAKQAAAALAELKNSRKNSKASMTRVQTAVESNADMSAEELECRLGVLESYYKLCCELQTRIERSDPNDVGRVDIDESYIYIKTKIRTALSTHGYGLNESLQMWPPTPTQKSSLSMLPPLNLPKFFGKYSEFKGFLATYNLLIHNNKSLCNTEKFNLLRQCLSAQALDALSQFPNTDENYTKAYERLGQLYDNDCLIFLEHTNNLFEAQKITKATQASLRTLVDKVAASYSAMKTLGTHEQICDAFVINIIMGKVDSETRSLYEETLEFKTLPNWKLCNDFLDRRCQRLEAKAISSAKTEKPAQPSTKSTSNAKQAQTKAATAHACTQEEGKLKKCVFCQSVEHWIFHCKEFGELSTAEKRAKVKALALCFNCLGQNHTALKCPSKHSCKTCKQKHHSLLHLDSVTEATATTQTACNAVKAMPTTSNQVILATARVLVKNSYGEYHIAKALLDSCSQVNFIREEFARALHLKSTRRCVNIDGINDCRTSVNMSTQTSIKSRLNKYEACLEFLVTPTVSSYCPDANMNPAEWNLPKNVELADPYFNQSQKIDMLIGGELFFDLLAVGQIKLGPGCPTLQKSTLGWLVVGCISREQPRNQQQLNSHTTTVADDTLEQFVNRFWQLEEVSNKASKLTDEQQNCEQFYVSTTKIRDDGRIITRLPFKDQPEKLGSSYEIALRRFYSLERRLHKNDALRTQYVEFMREYKNLGHMSLITNVDKQQPHYYIPHHCVLKPSSTTTKLRVVFDASAKTDSGVSLNEILMVGPTIQNELLITLLNFRIHRYCLTGDICKMYRQVLIDPTDQMFQLILWRESKEQPLETFALSTVTYGTSAAPFLAIRSLHFAAERFKEEFPNAHKVITSDFYVDDMVSGANSFEELLSIKREVTAVLDKSGFTITKWKSNHPDFINAPDVNNMKALKMDSELSSALGVNWDPANDELVFTYEPKAKFAVCSKRAILSQSSSLFDPMGFLSPILIRSKIVLQELWKKGITWDESVPQSIFTIWQEFTADLQQLHRIKIPRHFLCNEMATLEIHGFSDASTKAYGCVIYARCVNNHGKISSRIIVSKSRVAPIRIKTVPRLELCGAHLLATLWEKLKPALNISPNAVYFWSDSQIVLHWLKMPSSSLNVFVGNRVAEIQESSTDINWRHVPSDKNPADHISRGLSVEDLLASNWVHGPPFLLSQTTDWPDTEQSEAPKERYDEMKKSALICNERTNALLSVIHKCSSYLKLQRTFVYILRFIRIKVKHELLISNLISLQEMSAALHCVVSVVQQYHFAQEIRSLQRNEPIKGALSSLSLFIDKNSPYVLLRVGGRLENADISEGAKHPLLLPKADPFVTCMMRHIHQSNYHAGPKALVAFTRDQFWVLNAREAASKIVNNCIRCVKYRPKLMQQIMGNLPQHRVTKARPFQHCGVDFFGPVDTYLNIRGKVPYKCYVAVFICFATKAVHLEAVSDLSSNKFIEALKRMSGRRGRPEQIYCDNATNFVGASRALKKMREEFFKQTNVNDVHNFCTANHINFSFIPPRAPHFGGLWEAAVKVAKGHLLRTLSHARLTYEELSTALIEIEATMNSRPLCPLSSNANDFEALTPGHALIGSPLMAIPEPANIDSNLSHLQRFQRINAVKAHFWKRWHSEYLHELQNRAKWRKPKKELAVNDMVLVHEDNTSSMNWIIARVIKLIKGADGHVRVAELQTPKGVMKRAIVKLAPLPTC